MNPKVKRTLVLMAISASLFTISEVYSTIPWMIYVQGASAGFALAGIIGFVLILGSELKGKK